MFGEDCASTAVEKNNIFHRTHSTKFRTQITSNSLERLAAASGCMYSLDKYDRYF